MNELLEIMVSYGRYKAALEMLADEINSDSRYYFANESTTKAAFKVAGIELKEKDPTTTKQ